VEEAIFYKETQDAVYIRARGHITAALCTDLRAKVFEKLDSPAPVTAIHVDLSECDYMDSTFMGLIVGFRKKLQSIPGGSVTLYRPNPVCMSLLKGIGLTRLVGISDEAVSLPPFMENIAGNSKATAEFLLDVHENLMEISEENKAKFSVLSKVLKDQIDSGSGEDK
jgi:anti-anti-sigma factor